ncbi:long-chain fatty acid--CoA ligase [Salibacterium salarium]|uniref:Long-chain fatty acid--CoA ligase n=1 Tax=Salibacterium salarium TaxID=284579 RepID=A0A428N1J4_9BACI|nr:AMP-binding protein [Salibacterium salarium]RSL32216.1 long-chain fatty acid--CoA ligase [Salibacterium salarium]
MTTDKIWLRHYPDQIPSSLSYENKTLHSYLKEAAHTFPNKEALDFLGKTMTYGEVYDEALRLANQLILLGIKKGDRVAVMLANSPQAVICYYGVLMSGAIVVQTNPLYVEREIEHQVNDSEAKVMICLDALFPRVEKIRGDSSLEHVIVTSIKDYLSFPKNLIYPFVQKRQTGMKVTIDYNDNTHHLTSILASGQAVEPEVTVDPSEDLALLQYTGGTTGLAKGVMLTHSNLVINTQQAGAWMYRMRAGEERTLAALPFFHVYGMTVVMNFSIMYRSKMIILPKFDPVQALKAIDKHEITLFPGTPTMYVGLINEPSMKKYDLSSIKVCLSGSAPLPLEVQEKFEKLSGGKLVEGYGLTETSPVVMSMPIWGKQKTGSTGIPWPDTDADILSVQTNQSAKDGEIGEIIVKGPQVMKGYWNQPEETAASFNEDWFLTGDMGYRDEDGYFHIVDRKKNVIIAGGFNIYPREIEEVLYEHVGIQEAVVIGIPDPYRGETVKAFIVLKEHQRLTSDELQAFCRKRLASFKVPRLFEFRDELPKTMVGKVLRRVLLEEEKKKLQSDETTGNH